MLNWIFLIVLFVVTTSLTFVHFFEYQRGICGRYMSMTKVNLWFALGIVWFLNYLYCIFRTEISLKENLIGALGSLALAAFLVFLCYPKMSKACQKFLFKRYALIFVIGTASIFLTDLYLLIVSVGTFVTGCEIRRLEK